MARPRRFRYQTLLRVRERQEELKAVALGRVRRDIAVAQQERAAIVDEQRFMLEEAGRSTQQPFTAGRVLGYYQYEWHLARRAVEKDASIVQLKREEAERREELQEAMKKRRMVSKLKERHHEALQAELNDIERKQADEAATNRAAAD